MKIFTFIFAIFISFTLAAQENLSRGVAIGETSTFLPIYQNEDFLFFLGGTWTNDTVSLWKLPSNADEPILIVKMEYSGVRYGSLVKSVFIDHQLYFIMGASGDLWQTDGTPSGTKPLLDNFFILKMVSNGNIIYLYTLEGNSSFKVMGFNTQTRELSLIHELPNATLNTVKIFEKYKDGVLFNIDNELKYINSSLEMESFNAITDFSEINFVVMPDDDYIYFSNYSSNQLWFFDGENSPVQVLLNNEAPDLHIDPDLMFDFKGQLYFGAYMSDTYRLVTLPNSPTDMKIVKSFPDAQPYPNPRLIPMTENEFMVPMLLRNSSTYEYWRSDGTPQGTIFFSNEINASDLRQIIWFDNKLYFTKKTSEFGEELWASDGTDAGTKMVSDIAEGGNGSSPNSFLVFDNRLFFNADNYEVGQELWELDPQISPDPFLLKEINTSHDWNFIGLYEKLLLKDKLYFTAHYHYYDELWQTDGTKEGTLRYPTGNIYEYGILSDSLIIDIFDRHLRVRNGMGVPPVPYAMLPSGRCIPENDCFVSLNNRLYFNILNWCDDGFPHPLRGAGKIWVTDGTADGTYPLADVSGVDSNFGEIVNFKGDLYYRGDSSIRKINPLTDADTFVADILPNQVKYWDVVEFTALGNYLFFHKKMNSLSSDNNWLDLWATDGSEEGTFDFNKQDYWPSGEAIAVDAYAMLDSTLFVVAKDSHYGFEIWRTRFSDISETYRLTDIPSDNVTAFLDFNISEPMLINDRLLFLVSGYNFSYQLWSTDGTVEGTFLVKEFLNAFLSYSYPRKIKTYAINNKGYFSMNLEETGTELWQTDGTEEGTKMLFDLNKGAASSSPIDLTFFHDKIIFAATSDEVGRQLWSFDPSIAEVEDSIVPQLFLDQPISVFPNPLSHTSHQFSIVSTLDSEMDFVIKLYNIQGQLILEKNLQLTSHQPEIVSMSSALQSGLYILNAKSPETEITIRLIVQ